MDIASVVGLLLAVGLIIGSILAGTAPFTAYLDLPSVMVVVGGAAGAALICFPLKNIIGIADGRQESVPE